MNTANLQLEGVCVALSAVLEALRRSGALSGPALEAALTSAEDSIRRDGARREELSLANVEAMCFPVRYLLAASRLPAGEEPAAFSTIAAGIGGSRRMATPL